MSLDREKLTGLKESFWKVNEAMAPAFENDKVRVYGPVTDQEEMNQLGAGARWSVVQSGSNPYTRLNQYVLQSGQNIYVIIPKGYPKQKYAVVVNPHHRPAGYRERSAEWFDAEDHRLDDEEVLQLSVEFGLPHDLLEGRAKK